MDLPRVDSADTAQTQVVAEARDSAILALEQIGFSAESRVGQELLTTDPMEQFWNPYSYVGGDPLSGVDPEGLMASTDPVNAAGTGCYEQDLGQMQILGNIDAGTPQTSLAGVGAGLQDFAVGMGEQWVQSADILTRWGPLGSPVLMGTAAYNTVLGLANLGKNSYQLFTHGADMTDYQFAKQYTQATVGWAGIGAMAFGGVRGAGGGGRGVRIVRGSQVTEEVIREAMKDAPLKTQQSRGISLPMVQDYVSKLLAGEVAPPIRVDAGIIVEGNHRYVAGRIMGIEPKITDWVGGRPGNVVPWGSIPINPETWK